MREPSYEDRTCGKCGGEGDSVCWVCIGSGKDGRKRCEECEGTGLADCPACMGEGKVERKRTIGKRK